MPTSVQLFDTVDYQRRPAGLMAGTKTFTGFAVKVFVEQNQIAPMRIVGKTIQLGQAWATIRFAAHEQSRQPQIEFMGHLAEVHHLARTGGAFDLEVVAVKMVIPLERFDQQIIDGKPDRPSPVGIAAKEPAVRFARRVADRKLLPARFKLKRMFGVKLRQRANAVGR